MNQPAEIDLQPELHLFLVEWAQQYTEIEQIVLFGSRALGNAKKGSDVDLAVVGTQVTQSLVDKLHVVLEEDTLFFYFLWCGSPKYGSESSPAGTNSNPWTYHL